MFFITRIQFPPERKITYENSVYNYLPRKDDPYFIRLTILCDRLPYPSDSGSFAVNIMEAKIIFNGVISTPGSQFICADIKEYFPCSPMECFEYAKIPLC